MSCWYIDICLWRRFYPQCPSPQQFWKKNPALFIKAVDSTDWSFTSHRVWTLLWRCMDSIPCCGTRMEAAQALPWKAAWHAACLLCLAAWCSMANQHVLEHRLCGLGWNWPPNVPFQEKKKGVWLSGSHSQSGWAGRFLCSYLQEALLFAGIIQMVLQKWWARLSLDPRPLQPTHPLWAAQGDVNACPSSQPQLWLWGQKMPSS